MATAPGACPLDQRVILDRYFIAHRTRLLDIAAFLDRLARAALRNAEDDFRLRAFRAALAALNQDGGGRTQAVQLILSDPGTTLLPALDQKSADGAFNDRPRERAQG